MFNDLNQADNQTRPAVDDIFAETEQNTQTGQMPSSNGIEARHVGLTAGAGEDEPVEKNSGPWFKIAVVAIVFVILVLGGYLVYSKFMQPVQETDLSNNLLGSQPSDQTNIPTEVEPIFEENDGSLAATSSEEIIPLIPGVNTPELEATTTDLIEEVTPVVPTGPVDTDQDGLSDQEEAMLGTNINIVDTDIDGLSDYEEVKIYGTDPLLADTDGDTYTDGDEVRNGYNPLGAGKLGE